MDEWGEGLVAAVRLWAEPPVSKKQAKIRCVHGRVVIEIRSFDGTSIGTEDGKQNSEICGIHLAVVGDVPWRCLKEPVLL